MAATASGPPLHQATDLLSKFWTVNVRYLAYWTFVIFVVLPAYRYVRRDYHHFLALGPGGTPSNFAGYLRICYLRLFTLKDPLKPPLSAETERPANGFLLRLPKRPQPRPSVAGIAPHRQVDQKPPPRLYHRLRIALYDLVGSNPKLLRSGNSCFEKHGLALFLCLCPQCPDAECHTELLHAGPTHLNNTCQDTGEICHLHPSGWGERHPLAGCPIPGIGERLLPEGFVMIYAPQDETQIGVIMDIVRAAGWWVGGVGLSCKADGQGVLTRDTA
ncbi:MAG: hypothetical protein Q9219_007537 [cf. Caloplaca sp. 3 TL-2023]